MEYGFVYCLGNDYMPGVYKIGMTDRAPSRRCAELSSSTGVPYPFDILFFVECIDPRKVESYMHEVLGPCRISDNREFFQCDIREINRLFMIYKEDGCAYAETSHGSTELAMKDYEESQASEGSGFRLSVVPTEVPSHVI